MNLLPELTDEQVRKLAETPTPDPIPGVWLLLAPDGRIWTANSPIQCLREEQKSRIPARIALARIQRELNDLN